MLPHTCDDPNTPISIPVQTSDMNPSLKINRHHDNAHNDQSHLAYFSSILITSINTILHPILYTHTHSTSSLSFLVTSSPLSHTKKSSDVVVLLRSHMPAKTNVKLIALSCVKQLHFLERTRS